MRRFMRILCGRTGTVRFAVLVSAAAMAILLVVPAARAQSHKDWPSRITVATGPTGGFGYTMSAPWSATVSSAIGIPVSPEVTNGMSINVLLMEKDQVEIAINTSDVILLGWSGGGFAKGKKMQSARTMMMFVPFVFQIYTDARSDIKTIHDLNGKIVNPSGAGSQTDIVFRAMVKALDLKPAKINNVSPAQANDLMADGRLNLSMVAGSLPHPAPSQYEARAAMRLIGFTEEERKKVLDQNPQLSPMVIPAGTYKGQTKDLLTVGSYTMFVARKDMPDSLVYAMIKGTFDHKVDLANAYKAFGKLDLKSILLSPIPLHPGAVKYFEEHGVKIPDKLKG